MPKTIDNSAKQICKHFEFGAKIVKAFVKENGKHYVIAIASDTGVDSHGERFSEKAIDGMVNCINNSNSEEVLFLSTHWDTFEIGKVTYGKKINSPDLEDLKALEVEIELNMEYQQSKSLYKEVDSGKAQKQLSVGGYLDMDAEEPYFWESKEYITEDGNTLYDYILVLNAVNLDHIAVTRKNKAANDRTSFVEAIAKSLGIEKPSMDNKKEEEKMANPEMKRTDKQADSLISAISKSIQGFFAANSEDSLRIEKAKKASEDLIEISNFYKDSEIPKEINEIMKNFAKTDEDVVPAVAEVVAEVVAPVAEVATEKSIDIEALKSSIIKEVTESIVNSNKIFFEEVSKTLGTIIGETIKSQLKPINDKISLIETASGVSKSIDGQEVLVAATKEKDEDETNVWGGFIRSSLPKDFLNKKYDESEGK